MRRTESAKRGGGGEAGGGGGGGGGGRGAIWMKREVEGESFGEKKEGTLFHYRIGSAHLPTTSYFKEFFFFGWLE